MTWCPTQVCNASFAHAGHIWGLGNQTHYCPGVWTQSTDSWAEKRAEVLSRPAMRDPDPDWRLDHHPTESDSEHG
jgi:hypothetical protein